MNLKNIKIGADPEMFIKEINSNKIVPCVGVLGGTKEKPLELIKGNPDFLIQEDNVMAEFCIPPASTAADFAGNIAYAISLVNNQLKYNIPIGLTTEIKPSHIFDEDQLASDQAKRFGCDPDYNVYTLEQNMPISDMEIRMRTCGGHVHVGYDDPNEETSLAIVKAMDLFLGVPSILMDTDKKRRSMYGKAGCFRLKKYGVEYRTLSNFWIKNPILSSWVFQNTMLAINSIDNLKIDSRDQLDIIHAINNQDMDYAKLITEVFNVPVIEPNLIEI